MNCELCSKSLTANEAIPYEDLSGEATFLCDLCFEKVTSGGDVMPTEESTLTEVPESYPEEGSCLSTPPPHDIVPPKKKTPLIDRTSKGYAITLLIISYVAALYINGPSHRTSQYWISVILIPLAAIAAILAFNNAHIRMLAAGASRKLGIVSLVVLVLLIFMPSFKIAYSLPAIIVFGPSFIGLGIAVWISSKTTMTSSKAGLLFLALLLHGITCFMMLVLVRFGEAWSGYSSSHNSPVTFLLWGGVVIVFISMIRSKPMQDIADFFKP